MKADATPAILIIEDEAGLAQALKAACEQLGQRARVTANARAGLEQARHLAAALRLIILDIGLPDRSGLDLLPELRALLPRVPVLIITAHGSLQNAVAAKQQGAAEYLVKPLDLTALEQAVNALLQQSAAAPAKTAPAVNPQALTGSSLAMQPVFKAIAQACTSSAPVLLRGPSGSGKTLAASVIHAHSQRAAGPFITLPCGGLTAGAAGDAILNGALLESARGGTLLLDEICDLPADSQALLLRLVETPPGSRDAPDVRIIAATQRDLASEVTAGRFRRDLYFRLHVIEIVLPALRQRMEDIPALTATLLERIAPGRGLQPSPDFLARLASWDWPGHVRELKNALEHAVSVSPGPLLLPAHLPAPMRAPKDSAAPARRLDSALAAWVAARLRSDDPLSYDALHDDLEGRLLAALLPHFDNRPTRLAAALNMNRNTLRKRLGRDAAAD